MVDEGAWRTWQGSCFKSSLVSEPVRHIRRAFKNFDDVCYGDGSIGDMVKECFSNAEFNECYPAGLVPAMKQLLVLLDDSQDFRRGVSTKGLIRQHKDVRHNQTYSKCQS